VILQNVVNQKDWRLKAKEWVEKNCV